MKKMHRVKKTSRLTATETPEKTTAKNFFKKTVKVERNEKDTRIQADSYNREELMALNAALRKDLSFYKKLAAANLILVWAFILVFIYVSFFYEIVLYPIL